MVILRDDLASMVGTENESVIRTFSEFKGESLIEIQGNEITVVDPEGLSKLRF